MSVLYFRLVILVFMLSSTCLGQEFRVVVQRQGVRDGLVIGKISVNGQVIGNAYENDDLKIRAGTYNGVLRYWSGKGFAQGPFGTIGRTGDFLLEVSGVQDRTDILFHGGNRPEHSRGCILLGPVNRDPSTGTPALDENHPLVKLRRMFYGTNVPDATPNKNIQIQVKDPLDGTWKGSFTLEEEIPLEFQIIFQNGIGIATAPRGQETRAFTAFPERLPRSGGRETVRDLRVNQNGSVSFKLGIWTFSGRLAPDRRSISGRCTSPNKVGFHRNERLNVPDNGTWELTKQ